MVKFVGRGVCLDVVLNPECGGFRFHLLLLLRETVRGVDVRVM